MQGSVQITVEIPSVLADEATPARARELLVLDAVRSERMSWRAAARALGLSPSALLDLAREHRIPIVRIDLPDWRHDLATLDHILRRPEPAG